LPETIASVEMSVSIGESFRRRLLKEALRLPARIHDTTFLVCSFEQKASLVTLFRFLKGQSQEFPVTSFTTHHQD